MAVVTMKQSRNKQEPMHRYALQRYSFSTYTKFSLKFFNLLNYYYYYYILSGIEI